MLAAPITPLSFSEIGITTFLNSCIMQLSCDWLLIPKLAQFNFVAMVTVLNCNRELGNMINMNNLC